MKESSSAAEGIPDASKRPTIRELEFGKDLSFQTELRRRIDAFFESSGRRKRDCWQMYLKTAIILACSGTTYVLLVFVFDALWVQLLLAAMLGLCMAAIGFDIQHDGGHNAYSARRWVNRLMAWMLDLVGVSSGRWRWKHAVIHHRYVNITGYDSDIDLGRLARYTPHQTRRGYHRWQHLYLWPLYGLLAIEMQIVDDFRYVITGRLGDNRVPRPHGWELVVFVVGKALFLTWLFVIPMLLHPVLLVLLWYAVAAMVLGVVMALVFIIPHLVDKADFPVPDQDTGRIDTPWAVHQARVTVNFAMRNPILTWLLGGLNYHKEHHLFPLICHVNYPAMSTVVEKTCEEFGIPYHRYPSFLSGLVSHYRWLRQMGRPDSSAGAASYSKRESNWRVGQSS